MNRVGGRQVVRLAGLEPRTLGSVQVVVREGHPEHVRPTLGGDHPELALVQRQEPDDRTVTGGSADRRPDQAFSTVTERSASKVTLMAGGPDSRP